MIEISVKVKGKHGSVSINEKVGSRSWTSDYVTTIRKELTNHCISLYTELKKDD